MFLKWCPSPWCLGTHYLSFTGDRYLRSLPKKKDLSNNPCPLAGVSLVLVERRYELLKASEEQVSAQGLVLRTPQPCVPIAQPRFQLPLAVHQRSPGKTSPVVPPPCASHVSPGHLARDTASQRSRDLLSTVGLQATQAEISSDSSNPRLPVFIDPVHVLS